MTELTKTARRRTARMTRATRVRTQTDANVDHAQEKVDFKRIQISDVTHSRVKSLAAAKRITVPNAYGIAILVGLQKLEEDLRNERTATN